MVMSVMIDDGFEENGKWRQTSRAITQEPCRTLIHPSLLLHLSRSPTSRANCLEPTSTMRSIQHPLLTASLFLMTSTLIFRRIDAFALTMRQPTCWRIPMPSISCPPFLITRQRHVDIDWHRNMSTTRYATSKQSNHNYEQTNSYTVHLRIPTPQDMEEIAALLSVSTTAGDVILLDGDLGAGKTCFSRGFIRARTGYEDRITSPTYLLSNEYSTGEGEVKVHHLDLYRLNGSREELAPLDLDNVFNGGIALVEWPERLVEIPVDRLDVTLTIDLNDDNNDNVEIDEDIDADTRCRLMKLQPYGDRWRTRLQFYESEGYFEDLIFDNED